MARSEWTHLAEGEAPEAGAGEEEVDPLIGRVLDGRFTILEPLGVGGMGRVYKALQAPLDRMVALKVLKPSYSTAQDPGFQKRFFLEASLTAKLHHPNTITVHDYGRTEDGVFYIAMEYVEGQTLAALLTAETCLPWARALNIAQQICRSLREAHKFGILHRDLKPANVMLLLEETVNDVVKVLDFGLVKSFTSEAPRTSDETELTQAGVLLGSPLYMSPEQARNQADPRSDIYSLGVMLYQMIAGRTPFEGRESIDVIVKHLREQPPMLRSLQPGVPASIEGLVMRCLAKEPAKRYQSMDEVLEAMRKAAIDSGISGAWKRAPSIVMPGLGPLAEENSSAPFATGAISLHSQEVNLEITDVGRRTRRIYFTLFAIALTLGGVFATLLLRRGREPLARTFPTAPPRVIAGPASQTPAGSKDPQAPLPEPVTFHILSSPPGAQVSFAGKELGKTPIDLSVPAQEPDGSASAELTFTLEGYAPLTATASGTGAAVSVHPHLTKRRPTPRPKPLKAPPPPPGYKDDPYQ